MLLIISDLHLTDGTTTDPISSSAFELFAGRLQETLKFASWRVDGKYRPIEEVDIVLMGDIIDPLHSTLWLDTLPGDENYIRPWSDPYSNPHYAEKLLKVTRATLEKNKTSLDVLRACADGEIINIAPGTKRGLPDQRTRSRIPVKVRIHYMVGNHDWYYHLRGEAFDQIRQEIIDAMGLCNANTPFPYTLDEDPMLKDLFAQHKVYGLHGDFYDKFNFDIEKGRDYGTIGDAFTMDVCNRFPIEVEKRYKNELPLGLVNSLRKMTNIRPALAIPLWISGQIRSHVSTPRLEHDIKEVWDDIAEEFLQLDYVREADKSLKFDVVDAMQMMIKISSHASFSTIDEVVRWVHDKMWGGEHSFAQHALQEPAFLNGSAQYIVYGHTHHHEIVPLDMLQNTQSQLYFNSGTWHSYYDLAVRNLKEQKFVPYQSITYLTFYRENEHDGRRFETWSGAYA
jgi:UDP-2,3-diacylglucosamine pyrophosphatase LpxH